MSKQDDKRRRAKYTLEFKLEALRLVKAGQDAAVTSRVLGIPKATLGNWIRASEKGALVWCANLFCTYLATRARAAFARVTLARMSAALAVQINGLGSLL